MNTIFLRNTNLKGKNVTSTELVTRPQSELEQNGPAFDAEQLLTVRQMTRAAIHRIQAALATIERRHVGGTLRKVPRMHHAARDKAGAQA